MAETLEQTRSDVNRFPRRPPASSRQRSGAQAESRLPPKGRCTSGVLLCASLHAFLHADRYRRDL